MNLPRKIQFSFHVSSSSCGVFWLWLERGRILSLAIALSCVLCFPHNSTWWWVMRIKIIEKRTKKLRINGFSEFSINAILSLEKNKHDMSEKWKLPVSNRIAHVAEKAAEINDVVGISSFSCLRKFCEWENDPADAFKSSYMDSEKMKLVENSKYSHFVFTFTKNSQNSAEVEIENISNFFTFQIMKGWKYFSPFFRFRWTPTRMSIIY